MANLRARIKALQSAIKSAEDAEVKDYLIRQINILIEQNENDN